MPPHTTAPREGKEKPPMVGFGLLLALDGFAGTNYGMSLANLADTVLKAYEERTPGFVPGSSLEEATSVQSALTSALLVGSMVGSMSTAAMADRFGRRKCVLAFSGLSVFFNLLCIVRTMWVYLFVMRVLVGFSTSGITTVVPMWLSELAPPKRRGYLTLSFQVFTTFGIVVSYGVIYATAATGRMDLWYLCMIMTAVFSFLTLAVSIPAPETKAGVGKRGPQSAGVQNNIQDKSKGELQDKEGAKADLEGSSESPAKGEGSDDVKVEGGDGRSDSGSKRSKGRRGNPQSASRQEKSASQAHTGSPGSGGTIEVPGALSEASELEAPGAQGVQDAPDAQDTPDTPETPLVPSPGSAEKVESWKTIFTSKAYVRCLLLSFFLPISQQMSGINSIIMYATAIFKTLGLDNADTLGALLIALCNFLSSCIAIPLIERSGRRRLMFIGLGLVLLGLVLFIVAYSGVLTDDISSAIMTGVAAIIFLVGFELGPGPLMFVIAGESYPQRARSKLNAATFTVTWICNLIVVFTFPYFQSWQVWAAFLMYAVFVALSCAVLAPSIIETKGKSLDEIEKLVVAPISWRSRRAAKE